MKKEQKKYIRNYYGIALLINLIPFLLMVIRKEKIHGEAQMGFLFFGIWSLICCIVYGIYFSIPSFNKNWEKIIGLFLPTLILSLVLFEFPFFIIIIILNLIFNGLFAWHLKKKTFYIRLANKQ